VGDFAARNSQKGSSKFFGVGIALIAALGHGAFDDCSISAGRLGFTVEDVWNGVGDVFDHDRHGSVRLVGLAAGQHFKDDDPQGVDIAAAVHFISLGLFRTHVSRGADDSAAGDGSGALGLGDFGNAEIGNIGFADMVEEDVARFQVAMDDAFCMGFIERTGRRSMILAVSATDSGPALMRSESEPPVM
jgi:hypothetical protein